MIQYQPTHHYDQGVLLTHTTTWPKELLEDQTIGPLFVVLSAVSLEAMHTKCEWENDDKSRIFNYLQIFIKTVDRLQVDAVHSVNNIEMDQAMLLRKKCMESLRDVNCAYYFGHGQQLLEDNNYYRTMGGLMDFNLTEITEAAFRDKDMVKSVWNHIFAYGSAVRWMFVSQPYWKANGLPTLEDCDNGIPIVQMETELGTINIAVDHILDFNGANLDAVILDMSKLRRRYLKNRDWHLIELPEEYVDPGLDHGLRVKRNDVRYRILGELGLDVIDPILHYKVMKELPKVPKGFHGGSTLEEMKEANRVAV